MKKSLLLLALLSVVILSGCEEEAEPENQEQNASTETDAAEDDLVDLDEIEIDTTAIIDTGATTAPIDIKIGYVKSNEILSGLSDIKEADQQLQQYSRQLQTQLQREQERFQQKYMQYMQDTTASETVVRARQEEMMAMQNNLMQLEMNLQEDLENRRQQLYRPILDKIDRVIQVVARERGYTHVLDQAATLYIHDAFDLTPAVKAKLGIRN